MGGKRWADLCRGVQQVRAALSHGGGVLLRSGLRKPL